MKCQNCGKDLRHNEAYCPEFPDVPPPPLRHYLPGSSAYTEEPGRKWRWCACLMHTCSMRRQPKPVHPASQEDQQG